jgi:transcriptional antiterminator NusG
MEEEKKTSVEKAIPTNKNNFEEEVTPNESQEDLPEKAWYVINTFSNREMQVKEMLEKRMVSMHIADKIFNIVVAQYEEPVYDKDGKQKMTKNKVTGVMEPAVKQKNYYPGYIFVEMIMTDWAWYVVRNTPGVSGITGSSGKGTKPFPIPREEIEPVLKRMNIADPLMFSDYKVGDVVKIIYGTFADAEGPIQTVDKEKSEVTVAITLFGRPQIITAEYSNIEKVERD